jgi:hypothetical protein
MPRAMCFRRKEKSARYVTVHNKGQVFLDRKISRGIKAVMFGGYQKV